jgi:hypothetical protein
MKRIAFATCVVGAALATIGLGSGAASASTGRTLCVGGRAGCYSAIQPAVNAAHDGDTVLIAPGTYAGGITVDADVAIIGAGAGSTVIKGGGPVLTIAAGGAELPRTVSIAGVTITGGVVTSTTDTRLGLLPFVAQGGGVWIPGTATGIGATVTIRNSVITHNRSTPGATIAGGDPCPGGGMCPFAIGNGGGIADVGRLTLINTTVSDNVAGGGLASDANGGGIWTATNGGPGALTLINSTVTGNNASVSAPNGRFVEGGGIEVQDGEAFSVINSVVSNNTASVSNTYPGSVGMNADSGGIHTGGFGSATIENSRITGNVVTASDPQGQPGAEDAALAEGSSEFCVCGQTFALDNAVISGNRTSVVSASSENGQAVATVEVDSGATISNTAITGNSTSMTALAGSAAAFGSFLAFDGQAQPIVMRNSVISGNSVKASSFTGPASVEGAGIANTGLLELHGVQVANNTGTAVGHGGLAVGGGIWSGILFPDDGATPSLLLDNTIVTRNMLNASHGLTVQGGGVYTPGFAFTSTSSTIAHNVPDQCFGC